jgi:hypothetical protein
LLCFDWSSETREAWCSFIHSSVVTDSDFQSFWRGVIIPNPLIFWCLGHLSIRSRRERVQNTWTRERVLYFMLLLQGLFYKTAQARLLQRAKGYYSNVKKIECGFSFLYRLK